MDSLVTANESSSSPICIEEYTYEMSFSIFRIGISSVLIATNFITNTILALFLWRAKSARKSKNGYVGFYLFNLCTIDFIAAFNYSVITGCSILSKFKNTCPQGLLWRTYSSVHILLSSAWITTVAVMVFERLLITKNTLLRRESLRRMKYKLYFTWIWAISNALPQLIWYKYVNVETYSSCNNQVLAFKRIYPASRVITMFFLPSSIILMSIFGVLTRDSCESALSLKRKKGHERFVHLVLLLWLTFFCSNIPKVIYEISTSELKTDKPEDNISRRYQHVYIVLVSWTIHLITPIVYFIVYAKTLKTDFKKLRKQYPTETRRTSHFSIRRFSSEPSDELDGLSTRSILLNLGMHEDNILQKLSIDIGYDDASCGRRTSIIVEHMRKHSLFGSDVRKISRKQSTYRKRSSATAETFLNDGRYLTPLPPTFEYSVNTLNQRSPLLEENRTRGRVSSSSLSFFGNR